MMNKAYIIYRIICLEMRLYMHCLNRHRWPFDGQLQNKYCSSQAFKNLIHVQSLEGFLTVYKDSFRYVDRCTVSKVKLM